MMTVANNAKQESQTAVQTSKTAEELSTKCEQKAKRKEGYVLRLIYDYGSVFSLPCSTVLWHTLDDNLIGVSVSSRIFSAAGCPYLLDAKTA